MTQHDLTKIIGNCGKFHVGLTLATYAAYMSVAWVIIFMVFGLYNPGWICLDDEEVSNATGSSNITMSTAHSSSVSSNTSTEGVTVWSTDCTLKKKCRNFMYNPESSTVVTEWDLTCDLDWVPSVIISIQMSGVLIGAYMAGQLGEKFGRKCGLYIFVGVHALGQWIIAFSVSWQMHTAFLFILGMSSGGILAASYHYPLEFVNSWWRGVLSSIPVWNFGTMLFAFSTVILKDWRHIHICGAVIATLIFLTVFWVPESVRWLAVTGKIDKAKRIVARINRINGTECQNTKMIDDIADEEASQTGGHKYTYLDLFRIEGIRIKSIMFGYIWIVMAMSYYGISFGIKSLHGNFYLNFALFSTFDLPMTLTVGPLVTKLGRRKSAILYFAVVSASALSTVIVFLVASGETKDIVVLIFAITAKSVTLGAWYIIKLLAGELFPTVVRSLHFGYVNSIGRIGSILSPYIMSKNTETLYIPFLVISILNLIICGILYTMPETKGRQLQDRAKVEYSEVILVEKKSEVL